VPEGKAAPVDAGAAFLMHHEKAAPSESGAAFSIVKTISTPTH